VFNCIYRTNVRVQVTGPSARIFDMIYLLTAVGLTAGDRSTVHIYTQTIHRTIQNK